VPKAFEHLRQQSKKAEDFTRLQKGTLHGIEPKPLPYLLCQTDDQISEQKSFTNGRIVVAGTKVKRRPDADKLGDLAGKDLGFGGTSSLREDRGQPF
jgi:hypothetical protein